MAGAREVEVKAVVDDWAARRRRVEAAGGRLRFEGRLEDRRYDTPERTLVARDEVLRLRVYRDAQGERGLLDWKGPTTHQDGYKVREEISSGIGRPAALAAMLERLGYLVIRAIDRDIAQYELAGATVRFERYPRMDDLVEVEGEPDGIERAIAVLGLPREAFTSERLADFARRFQERTGERALLGDGDRADGPAAPLEDA